MAASFPKSLNLAVLVVLLAWQASAAAAAHKPAQQPIILDAQSGELDLHTGNEVFHKVRISQGDMVVTADQAQASQPGKLNFNNSVLTFRGAVKINTDKGLLTADEAQLMFVENTLTKAVAAGKPAAFEQRVGKTGKQAKGQAESIDYDVPKGIVRFTKNAFLSLSDPQYEIHAQAIKYDSINQKIIAEESEQGSQRIHSIFTPPTKNAPPPVPPP